MAAAKVVKKKGLKKGKAAEAEERAKPSAKGKVADAKTPSKERQEDKASAGPKGNKKAKARDSAKAKAKAKAKAAAPRAKKSKANRLAEAQEQEEALEAAAEEDGGAAQKAPMKKKKAEESDEEKPAKGVIYVGHLPEGLFEPQMKSYFEQFGDITRLRISRSKKTGNPKGYGWIEYEDEEVAKIVQETMNGYLIYGRKLVVEVVPPEKQHPGLFKNWKAKFVDQSGRRQQRHREAYNQRPVAEVDGERIPRQTLMQALRSKKSTKKLQKLLASLEVDFDPSEAIEGGGIPAPTSPRTDLARSKQRKKGEATPAAVSPKVAPVAAPQAAKKRSRADSQPIAKKKARKA